MALGPALFVPPPAAAQTTAPSVLRVVGEGHMGATALDGAIGIRWKAPTSNGGAEIAGYRVYWYEIGMYASTKKQSDVTAVAKTGDAVQDYANTGLTNGTSRVIIRYTGTGSSRSFWGRASRSGFNGRDGDTSVDGEVTGVMLGTDWKRKGTVFGMVLSRSRGTGTGTYSGATSGEIDVALTGLVPWAGREIGRDRLRVARLLRARTLRERRTAPAMTQAESNTG